MASRQQPGPAVLKTATELAAELDALDQRTQANSSESALHAVEAVEKLSPAEFARPAALKQLLQLLAFGDSRVQRLALNLLVALVASGPEAGDYIRDVGGIGALTQTTLVALKSVEEGVSARHADDEAEAAFLALTAVRTLLLGASCTTDGGGRFRSSGAYDAPQSRGTGHTGSAVHVSLSRRQPGDFGVDLAEFQEAGGVPMLVAALQCEYSMGAVEAALAIIDAAVTFPMSAQGGGRSVSAWYVAHFLGELLESQALHAMALIVADSERSRQWNAAHEVVRIFADMVSAEPACLPAVQGAHGVAAIITLLQINTGDTRLAPAAQQALAHFGRHYIPAEGGATPSGDEGTGPDGGDGPEETEVEGSLPSIAALRLSESSTANQGLVGKSALHWAAQFGESRLLHELLRSVVDNNAVDGAGNTPLHLAALNGHLECVEQLLTKGADSLAYNGDLHLPCDMTESRSPVWGVLEHDMQWRTALQASHPCQVLWASASEDYPAAASAAAAQRSARAHPERHLEAASGLREPQSLRCRFDPLSGEVCIVNGQEQADGKGSPGSNEKVKKGKKLQRALLACVCRAHVTTLEGQETGGKGLKERYQVPYTLAVSAVDKLTLELDFSPADPVGGALGNDAPPAVVASITVHQCSAAYLAPALGTMLTRLFPHIFRAQAPLRKCQLQLEELAAGQRLLAEAAHDAPTAYSARQRQAALGRRLARRLDTLQLLLTASDVELSGVTRQLEGAGTKAAALEPLAVRTRQQLKVLTSYRAQVDEMRASYRSLLAGGGPTEGGTGTAPLPAPFEALRAGPLLAASESALYPMPSHGSPSSLSGSAYAPGTAPQGGQAAVLAPVAWKLLQEEISEAEETADGCHYAASAAAGGEAPCRRSPDPQVRIRPVNPDTAQVLSCVRAHTPSPALFIRP